MGTPRWFPTKPVVKKAGTRATKPHGIAGLGRRTGMAYPAPKERLELHCLLCGGHRLRALHPVGFLLVSSRGRKGADVQSAFFFTQPG